MGQYIEYVETCRDGAEARSREPPTTHTHNASPYALSNPLNVSMHHIHIGRFLSGAKPPSTHRYGRRSVTITIRDRRMKLRSRTRRHPWRSRQSVVWTSVARGPVESHVSCALVPVRANLTIRLRPTQVIFPRAPTPIGARSTWWRRPRPRVACSPNVSSELKSRNSQLMRAPLRRNTNRA